MTELTAHRTLALRDALAGEPHVAFQTVLHALCLAAFYRYASDTCLEITAKSSGFAAQAPGLAETASAKAIDARHDQWAKQLPETPADLWDALTAFDSDSQAALFAHCASLTVNVVKEPWNRRPDAFAHGDQLARAVNLDMAAAGWRPTADNYLGRVPKARILEAVREAKGEQSAQLIDHLKKAEMAKEAERLLDGTGWLPEPLRLAEIETDDRRADRRSRGACRTSSPATRTRRHVRRSDEEPAAHRRGRVTVDMRGGFGRPAPVSPSNSTRKPGHRAGLSRFRSHVMTEHSPTSPIPAPTSRRLGRQARASMIACSAELRPCEQGRPVRCARRRRRSRSSSSSSTAMATAARSRTSRPRPATMSSRCRPVRSRSPRAVWGSAELERTTHVRPRRNRDGWPTTFSSETHDGWENSDGAYGDFTFDVAERTITLDYNERHMESDYSQHVF